jgi:NAD(P) transhydrogenase subunit alpha
MSADEKRLTVGVPKETFPGERRVGIVPSVAANIIKAEIDVLVEAGAGDGAGIPDHQYEEKGSTLVPSRDELFSRSDVILQVRCLGANPQEGRADLDRMRSGQVFIGMSEPLSEPGLNNDIAKRGITQFSLELLPRITRAQNMDILSSMATVAGYKSVLLAAASLPRIFPMFMTAAGTIAPARVFVVGAGVAGLQAIATAKRLGAVVSAYDVRPVVKEQVESLGAKFVELELEADDAEDKGGYAKEMDEEFYKRQREMMLRVVAENDVVITTAAIPGKKAPILVTKEMVEGMIPGSVIVDLAAERGGNCELVIPGDTTVQHGVTIIGPLNIPSTVPYHSSQMYARNVKTFLLNLVKDAQLHIDMEDEIIRDTMITRDGEIVNEHVRKLLGATKPDSTQGGTNNG